MNKELAEAIDDLADLYRGGHLLASALPVEFVRMIHDDLVQLRAETEGLLKQREVVRRIRDAGERLSNRRFEQLAAALEAARRHACPNCGYAMCCPKCGHGAIGTPAPGGEEKR